MSSPQPDIHFIESYFNLLSSNGIDYGIMRNAEEVATGDAHDIDICIQALRMQDAENLLSQQAHHLGWKLHLSTGSPNDRINIKTYNYYYEDAAKQEIYIVHIDVFPTFAWKGYELISNNSLLKNLKRDTPYHRISCETESVCNLFIRLLYNGKIKEKYKSQIYKGFLEGKTGVRKLMNGFLSDKLSDDIYAHVINKNWDIIENLRNKIVRDIRKHTKRHLLLYLKYLFSKAFNRKGIIIAFQGTDGSGKTTIIKGIERTLGRTFSNDTLNYYHWRPGFIKSEKRLDTNGNVVSNVQPHTECPCNKITSLIKMLVYTVDYILGYWFKVYRQAAQGHLVVFDRYYYDFYMDKARYRLNIGNWIIRLLHLFIPKPDITFVLLGDAEKIHARKNELPLEEVQRQIDLLRANKRLFASPVVVDVCRSIPEVVYTVSSNILKKLSGQKLG